VRIFCSWYTWWANITTHKKQTSTPFVPLKTCKSSTILVPQKKLFSNFSYWISSGRVEWPCRGKGQVIREHFSPSKLGLTHMRHLILVASLDSHVDNGFGDHFSALKIYSWSGLGFLVVVFKLEANISRVLLLPPTLKSSKMMN